MGPSFDVRCYNECIVGGLRYHISECDSQCTTQNSGLMVIGESDPSGSGDNNFYGTMSSFSCAFLEMDAVFLEFTEDLDNPERGSSLVDDNSGTSQPFVTPTLKRHAQSRLLELERYVEANGQILMTIAPGVEKPISPHVVCFRKYIEVIKDDRRFFMLDFNDQAMNRFIEHQMLNTFKEFQGSCHRHFKKYSDSEEACANPLHLLVGRDED
ncbi:CACTA en-spm transposon protein [Cucumis melo var. makuwa]|uniref:CACTA en-spm transposon protein n=1 Tax=Cucumis melo var. makuwa TaxID=1194695 RepID=A0A5D3D4U4_CUCMM|nr:CACTA en-spm transposon protein [Cucumis melo var. makuwa]